MKATGVLMNFMLNGSVFNLSSQWLGFLEYSSGGETLYVTYKWNIVFNTYYTVVSSPFNIAAPRESTIIDNENTNNSSVRIGLYSEFSNITSSNKIIGIGI